MTFKENILLKIKINSLAGRVMITIGPVGSGQKIDKQSMRSMLEIGRYKYKRTRGLDLYFTDEESKKKNILVLDNELPIYSTTIMDVKLRKNPVVKEMLNIPNVFKILNDKDVIVSKRENSLEIVRQECLRHLDLTCEEKDINEIFTDGKNGFETGSTENVLEAITIFNEILEYSPPPISMKVKNHDITGELVKREDGEIVFGPAVIYDAINNTLKLFDGQVRKSDLDKIDFFHNVVSGNEDPSKEGIEVLQFLKEEALKKI